MDYYNYQNCRGPNTNQSIPQTPSNSFGNKDGKDSQKYYLYQNVTSFPPADPRLNYSYCPTASNISQLLPNNEIIAYDLQLSQSNSDIAIKSDDELWIETWLSKLGKIQINLNSTITITAGDTSRNNAIKTKNAMQIRTAKNILKNCLQVINKLEEMQEFLKDNAATMSSADWRKNTLEIGAIKNEFSTLFSQFENPEVISQLRKSVDKRRKKRNCQKRRKKKKLQEIVQLREEKRKAHKDVDLWLKNMKEKTEKIRMEENMKKNVDCVLAEVTKRKSDARKLLSLISSLVKLRSVREQAAIQKSEEVSVEDSSAFAKVTNNLTKIWANALQIYLKEEQGLRIMLEQNAAEDTIAAQNAKERKVVQEWEVAFFGSKCIPSPAYWGLTVAEKDLETFIAIRKSWDTFLTSHGNENGSKIPIGWVAPNPHPHENWAKYLSTL